MPLLKGYDDYDKEISRLFGLDSKEVLSLIDHHTKYPLRFKKMKTISHQDLESYKISARVPEEIFD